MGQSYADKSLKRGRKKPRGGLLSFLRDFPITMTTTTTTTCSGTSEGGREGGPMAIAHALAPTQAHAPEFCPYKPTNSVPPWARPREQL